MVTNVGSMAVMGKFNVGGVLSGFKNIIGNMKQTGMESKNLNVSLKRMTGSMMAMSAAAGITGIALLGMLVKAVMTSPLLAGALAKLRVAFMLFGNTIAKHVKPIIEWFVKGVKWLHARFKALPDSVQSAIVKFVLIGGVILTLLPIVSLLITALGFVKTGLITIGVPAVITAIAGSTAAMVAFGAAVGVVAGLLGVYLLLKSGVLDFVANLGEGFRTATGSAAVLRDMLVVIVGYFGAIGMAAIDIASGDFGLGRMKASLEVIKEAKNRLWTGEGYDGETSTSINLPANVGGGSGAKTNTVNMDFNGANFEIPQGQDALNDWLSQIERMQAEQLQVKQV